MNTLTPGDLSARLREIMEAAREVYRISEREHVAWHRLRDSIDEAAAALSALPAAGGAVDYTDIANRAQEITGRSIFPSTVEAVLKVAGSTTPQPSAAEGDVAEALVFLDSEIDATGAQSYNPTVAGFMRVKNLIRRLAADAAVGAQGLPSDALIASLESREALRALARTLRDECHRLAAPAAGKGVDDAMRRRAREWLAANNGYWDDDYIERLLRAILPQAALTRQPVAGDGMVLVKRDELNFVLERGTAAMRKLAEIAPAATPTDGGEGASSP